MLETSMIERKWAKAGMLILLSNLERHVMIICWKNFYTCSISIPTSAHFFQNFEFFYQLYLLRYFEKNDKVLVQFKEENFNKYFLKNKSCVQVFHDVHLHEGVIKILSFQTCEWILEITYLCLLLSDATYLNVKMGS